MSEIMLDASAEVVRTLRAEGLSFSEIARLCAIPYAVTSLSRLEQGTATRVSKGTHDALQAGYARYLDGERGYVKRRGTRPGLADEVLPASSTYAGAAVAFNGSQLSRVR